MLTSVRMRSLGIASNRRHLNQYQFSNLLFRLFLILNHNFMRFFGSLSDLLMDALDGRRADGSVLPSHTQRRRVTVRYALPALRSRWGPCNHPDGPHHPVAMIRPRGAWYPSIFIPLTPQMKDIAMTPTRQYAKKQAKAMRRRRLNA